MKKLISILLIITMVFALASCGKDKLANGDLSSMEESSSVLEEGASEDIIEPSEEESSKDEIYEESVAESKPVTQSKPESSSSTEPPIPKPESEPQSSVPSKPSVTATDVYNALDKAIVSRHSGVTAAIMNMPMDVDDAVLKDAFNISVDDTVGYKGVFAGSMTNCDIMIVVEAKDGKKDAIKKALEAKLDAQKQQFEHYGVMGNIERLEAAKIVEKGNFVALLLVGVMDETEESYDCAGDVAAASNAFSNILK